LDSRFVALRLVPNRLILEKIRKFFTRNRPALDQVWNQSGLLQSYEAIPGSSLKMESLGAAPNSNAEVIFAVSHASTTPFEESVTQLL
jgi:hypothetical protein